MCTSEYNCEDCVRKCSQFVCCICENCATCECAKINPPEEE